MKKVGSLKFVALLVFGLLIVAGCGSQAEQPNPQAPGGQQASPDESVGDLTKDNPLQVNKEEGTVSFLAQVNGKYFYEPTRHGAVFAEGANGDKAIFRAFANHEDLYQALIDIGARAGDNMTMENRETTKVEGDAFDVTVAWPGAGKDVTVAVPLDEAITDSNGTPLDIRFGGNLTNAQDKKTGCLICLDSCPVGITSNAAYTFGAVETRKEVGFTGNSEVLPADGTYVAVTLKLKK
jgi:ferredoxin